MGLYALLFKVKFKVKVNYRLHCQRDVRIVLSSSLTLNLRIMINGLPKDSSGQSEQDLPATPGSKG